MPQLEFADFLPQLFWLSVSAKPSSTLPNTCGAAAGLRNAPAM